MPFYIISLQHTLRYKDYILLWCENNNGYTMRKTLAGEYETPEKGYHDGTCAMPIEKGKADKLFMETTVEGVTDMRIPNCRAVWDALGVKMTNSGLVRKK